MRCRAMCSHVMWCHLMWSDTMQWDGCYVFGKRCVWLRGHVMWCELGVSWGELEDDFLYSLYTTEHQCPRTTTLYFEVATKYYPVLPRISKYYKIFLRSTNTTPHFQRLPHTTKYNSLLQSVWKSIAKYKVLLQSITLHYKVLHWNTK